MKTPNAQGDPPTMETATIIALPRIRPESSIVLEGQDAVPVPFRDAAEAWFWFIQAWSARQDGARITAGAAGSVLRPCEAIDIFSTLERLHRNRRLLRDHLLVLRHYGRRLAPPDSRRPKEMRAYRLWQEAMDVLTPVFERKGIIMMRNWLKES